MSNTNNGYLIKEYRAIYAALILYKHDLEVKSELEQDEDKQLVIDEEIECVDGILRSMMLGARRQYGIELEG